MILDPFMDYAHSICFWILKMFNGLVVLSKFSHSVL